MSPQRAAHSQSLGLNSNHLARSNSFDRVKCAWDERRQILKGIARAAEHDDSNLSLRQVLLELKILIPGHENAKASGLSSVEQRSVL